MLYQSIGSCLLYHSKGAVCYTRVQGADCYTRVQGADYYTRVQGADCYTRVEGADCYTRVQLVVFPFHSSEREKFSLEKNYKKNAKALNTMVIKTHPQMNCHANTNHFVDQIYITK